jgi:sugar/nucleoside kinase (ribokinase family)
VLGVSVEFQHIMKPFQLCGLGNAIVDIFVEVSEPEFASLGFERGTMVLVDQAAQKSLLDSYQKHEPKLVSGGSVANSIIAFSQLGGQAAFIGCVGDDRYGLFYANEFEELASTSAADHRQRDDGNRCIMTPDAERTMRTCWRSRATSRAMSMMRIKNSDGVHRRPCLRESDTGQTAIQEAVRIAGSMAPRSHHLLGRSSPGLRDRSVRAQHADLLSATRPKPVDHRSQHGQDVQAKDRVPSRS